MFIVKKCNALLNLKFLVYLQYKKIESTKDNMHFAYVSRYKFLVQHSYNFGKMYCKDTQTLLNCKIQFYETP